MSNLFNIFSGEHGREAMWLESSTTLDRAKLRVDQMSAVFPGPYFVFNTASGRVVYQAPTPATAVAGQKIKPTIERVARR